MKHLIAAAALLSLFLTSCASPTRPAAHAVSGTVRFLDGRVVAGAPVNTSEGVSTRTDAEGRYTVPVRGPGSVTIRASEPRLPGQVYVAIRNGSIQVSSWPVMATHLSPRAVNADIVLDHADPI